MASLYSPCIISECIIELLEQLYFEDIYTSHTHYTCAVNIKGTKMWLV